MTTRGLDLKRRLRAGEVTIGAWISFSESAVAEIMAGTGFDWILIDTEHARGARFMIATEDQSILRVGAAHALAENRAALTGS